MRNLNSALSTPLPIIPASSQTLRSMMEMLVLMVRLAFTNQLIRSHKPCPDFVVDNGNIMNTNTSGGELAMLLTQENGGTRLSSTRYLHYGTVTAQSALKYSPPPLSLST